MTHATTWQVMSVAAALAVVAACTSTPVVEPATMVVRNGTIVTMDAAVPEVQALKVRGDRIVALGSAAEIAPFIGPATEVIDLAGLTAVPGLIEGHGHFMGLGQSRMVLDLMDVTNWDEIVRLVGAAAAKAQPGEWVRGRGARRGERRAARRACHRRPRQPRSARYLRGDVQVESRRERLVLAHRTRAAPGGVRHPAFRPARHHRTMQSGAIISNGTDVPVERIDPMPNLYATITRRLKDGTEFFPDQRMTRQEALKS